MAPFDAFEKWRVNAPSIWLEISLNAVPPVQARSRTTASSFTRSGQERSGRTQEAEGHRHQRSEVLRSPVDEQVDYQTKKNLQAVRFLGDGDKVKASLRFPQGLPDVLTKYLVLQDHQHRLILDIGDAGLVVEFMPRMEVHNAARHPRTFFKEAKPALAKEPEKLLRQFPQRLNPWPTSRLNSPSQPLNPDKPKASAALRKQMPKVLWSVKMPLDAFPPDSSTTKCHAMRSYKSVFENSGFSGDFWLSVCRSPKHLFPDFPFRQYSCLFTTSSI